VEGGEVVKIEFFPDDTAVVAGVLWWYDVEYRGGGIVEVWCRV